MDYIKEKKQFIKKCPVGDCEGYLSTSWKCGVCNTKVCHDCFVIKNNDEEHKCNKDDLASAEAIKKETRACKVVEFVFTKYQVVTKCGAKAM